MSYEHHMPIPLNITSKVMRTVCKIKFGIEKDKIVSSTGFFMRVSDKLKYLITMEIFGDKNLNNKNIEI